MSDASKIEWTDSTFNPWIGCTKVGPGCDHCYAEADFDIRRHRAKWGPGNPRSRTSAENWKKPLQWNKQQFFSCKKCGFRGDIEGVLGYRPKGAFTLFGASCKACGGIGTVQPTRRRVFCASLADVFDNEVPAEWRADIFHLIEQTPNLDWLLLTKRIGNAAQMIRAARLALVGSTRLIVPDVLPNVWIGATIVNQAEADRDIPKLLATPARVRFLSMEPLLGRVDLCETFGMWWNQTMDCFESSSSTGFNRNPIDQAQTALDWVIVGGESGAHARPMHPDWVRSMRDQCHGAGVPFLFKQWGEWGPTWIEANWHRGPAWFLDNHDPSGKASVAGTTFVTRSHVEELWPLQRHGKKAAGRLLDGVQHDGYPEVAA